MKKGSGGIGFPGALFIAFLALKLTGVIAWSWWWVLSPILIPGGIGVAAVLIMLLGYAVVRVFDRRKTDDQCT